MFAVRGLTQLHKYKDYVSVLLVTSKNSIFVLSSSNSPVLIKISCIGKYKSREILEDIRKMTKI